MATKHLLFRGGWYEKRILLTVLVVTAMTVSGAFAVEQFETVKKTETLTSSSTSVVTSEMKQTTAYQDLSAQDAKVLIDNHENVVIIDVSTRYAEGHVPGAVNHPISDGTLDTAIPTLDKDKMYLVYCHGDQPAIAAATKLTEAGFQHVYRLKGNYQAWVDAGYAVEK